MENDRVENAHHGKRPKTQTLENGEKCTYGKRQCRKCTSWKKTKNTDYGKWHKMHTQKLPELSLPFTNKMGNMENAHMKKHRIENGHHRKRQKMQTLENGKKCI